ncbi:mediator of RNA polymerase II transcription subunit 15a-like isoform X3 [Vitis riparia]|uniref:mediator of RNA polymerase II transcription subunit 15a-like isoform X3 n=1 Tax=Vitis riparia TaxID=96939 RepID=UPI00155A7F47|nr:mediator of RNA polymerase II transcription subunit 15a-like isoform X3 [Vitis riparia]
MDTNNWRPAQAEPAMDLGDWRTQLSPDSRQGAVNRIMDTLKRHLPVSGQEGLRELRKIALRFEEKIYKAATSQSDYLQKISLKILTMETKSQTAMPSNLPSNSAGNSKNPPDPEYNKLTTTQCQFGFRTRKCADFIAAEH